MAGSKKTSLGLRAIHSLSGVFPVGLFMLLQLWAHAKVLDGPDAHRAALMAVHPSNWATTLLIVVPLLFHVGYGLVLTFRTRYNVGRYPLSRNWTFTLQRATGVVALAFIGLTTLAFWGESADQLGQVAVATASRTYQGLPLAALGLLIGIFACVFHFTVGLWMIGVRYGFAATRAAQAQSSMAFGVVGCALFLWGGHTLTFMATGWSAVERRARADDTTVCDPSTVNEPAPLGSVRMRKYPKVEAK